MFGSLFSDDSLISVAVSCISTSGLLQTTIHLGSQIAEKLLHSAENMNYTNN